MWWPGGVGRILRVQDHVQVYVLIQEDHEKGYQVQNPDLHARKEEEEEGYHFQMDH